MPEGFDTSNERGKQIGSDETQAQRAAGLSMIDAAWGVIARPVTTIRQIATARPWVWSLALVVGTALLNGLVGLTTPTTGLMNGAPPELAEAIEGLLAANRSPAWIAVQAMVLAPISLAVVAAVLYGTGKLLGGRGSFSALISTLAFAQVPNILQAPLVAWLNVAGRALAPLAGVVSLGFGVWTLALAVLAVRESLALTTGRAVLAVLIPLTVVVVLVILVGIVLLMLALGAGVS